MEDKNTNFMPSGEPQDPLTDLTGNIPEDMPLLDLDAFTASSPAEDLPTPENLFDEPVFGDPEASAPTVPEVTPEEPAAELLPDPEPAPVLPTGELDSQITQEEPLALDFSQFDIPVEDAASQPLPEEIPAESAAPVAVYPGENSFFSDASLKDPDGYAPAEEAFPSCLEECACVDGAVFPDDPAASVFDAETVVYPTEDAPAEAAIYDDQEFTEMFETTAAAAPAEQAARKSSRPVRKGRPRRKKGDTLLGLPNLLATLVWLAIIVLIGVSLGRMLWVCAADVLAFGRENKEVVVTIDTDDTIDDIAQILQEKGLIRYPGVFKLYASIAVDEGEISPGTYTLNTILDYHALVGQMSSSSSSRAVVEDVLIPEGYNCRQIFELLEQNGICTVEELEAYAAAGEFQDFWFLEGLERGDKYCLEGYLFPDTYDFYAGSTPREAIGKMLLGFEARFTEELYNQLPALNERLNAMMRANGCSQEFIDSHQIGLHELLIVASLIEEETAGASESPSIASVIYNRLTQDQEYERYLGIDAAIIYATGDAENIDTSIDSPYNTYKNPGLTPGPISNPGLSSIQAALNFADTDYYYYVLNPSTGEHQFSKTYEEHQQWIEKFREMESGEG